MEKNTETEQIGARCRELLMRLLGELELWATEQSLPETSADAAANVGIVASAFGLAQALYIARGLVLDHEGKILIFDSAQHAHRAYFIEQLKRFENQCAHQKSSGPR